LEDFVMICFLFLPTNIVVSYFNHRTTLKNWNIGDYYIIY